MYIVYKLYNIYVKLKSAQCKFVHNNIINRSNRIIYRLQKTEYTIIITDLFNKINWLHTGDSIIIL